MRETDLDDMVSPSIEVQPSEGVSVHEVPGAEVAGGGGRQAERRELLAGLLGAVEVAFCQSHTPYKQLADLPGDVGMVVGAVGSMTMRVNVDRLVQKVMMMTITGHDASRDAVDGSDGEDPSCTGSSEDGSSTARVTPAIG